MKKMHTIKADSTQQNKSQKSQAVSSYANPSELSDNI